MYKVTVILAKDGLLETHNIIFCPYTAQYRFSFKRFVMKIKSQITPS